ncbi:hypothetical protein D3C76_1070850 [compost metagenome]
MHAGEAAAGPLVAHIGDVAEQGRAQGQQQAAAGDVTHGGAQGIGVEFAQQVPAGQQAEDENQQGEGNDYPLTVCREAVEPAQWGGFFVELAVGRIFHWRGVGAH